MNRRHVFVIFPMMMMLLAVAGCRGPAQVGADRDAFKAVDALYTAVGLREVPRVEACEARLHALADAGRLPPAALGSLDAIAAEAKGGAWESAQTRLAAFMEGQTR